MLTAFLGCSREQSKTNSKETQPGKIVVIQNNILTDSITPNQKYTKEIYDPVSELYNSSLDYSNMWDLDGDGKNDSVFFIGNGGAHVFYYLRVLLSSNSLVQDFPEVQLDMPYFNEKEVLDKYPSSPSVQFVVFDFDKDGTLDIYLNFDNHFGSIPKKWKRQGVTSKYVVMNFSEKKLKVKDYQNR